MLNVVRRRLASPVGVILLGSLIGQGAVLAVSPALTRLYGPEVFGTYALIVAVSAVLGGLVSLSWERAVVVPRDDHVSRSILLLGFGTVLTLSAGLLVLSYPLGRQLSKWIGNDVFQIYPWLVPATALSLGLYGLMSALHVRLRQYTGLAIRNGVMGTSQAVSGVALGIAGLSPLGLLVSVLVGRACAMLGMLRRTKDFINEFPTRGEVLWAARRYKNFPLVSTWSRVLNIIGQQLPTILIVTLFGSLEAGLFALVVRVLATPASFVTDAVSQYYEGTLAHRSRNALGGLERYLRRTVASLAGVAAVPAIVILWFGPLLFDSVFGAEWSDAGNLARIMALAYLAQFAVAPISKTLLVLERQPILLAWDFTRALLTTTAIWIPFILGANFTTCIMALTASQIAAYAILLQLCLRAAHRRDRQVGAAG